MMGLKSVLRARGSYRDSTLEEFRGQNRNYFEPVFHPRKPLDVEGLKPSYSCTGTDLTSAGYCGAQYILQNGIK